ncbi:unnamed protein product, partial [Prorocentrum cordatum]
SSAPPAPRALRPPEAPGSMSAAPAAALGVPAGSLRAAAVARDLEDNIVGHEQATEEVEVPKGLVPGDTFQTRTRDGQTVQVTVPPGVAAGSSFRFAYPARPPVPTVQATVIGDDSDWLDSPRAGGVFDSALFRSFAAQRAAAAERVQELHWVRQDRQASETGWLVYLGGWCLCCCCGPVGPILWFTIAGAFFCKPAEHRERFERERSVATVSLWTGVLTTLAILLLIAMYDEVGAGDARVARQPKCELRPTSGSKTGALAPRSPRSGESWVVPQPLVEEEEEEEQQEQELQLPEECTLLAADARPGRDCPAPPIANGARRARAPPPLRARRPPPSAP